MTGSKYERPSWHKYGCDCYICTKIDEQGGDINKELIHKKTNKEEEED